MARSQGTRYPRGGSELWLGTEAGPNLLRAEFFGAEPLVVEGTLAAAEAADGLSASGTVTSGATPVVGTLASTEGADVAAAAGLVLVRGALASTEAGDAAVMPGRVLVLGALSSTEGSDVVAAAGSVSTPAAVGSLAAVEGADTASASGLVLVTGSLASTEGADTAAASGNVSTLPAVGALAATEGEDVGAATGRVLVQGSAAALELGDAAGITGAVLVQGSASGTEAADALAAAGEVRDAPATGELAASENSDSATAAGTVGTLSLSITAEQALLLQQVAQLHGLLQPLTVSPTQRVAGDVVQQVVEAAGVVTISTTGRSDTLHADPGAMIEQLAALHGITAPLVVSATQRSAGAIVQAIAATPQATTVTRQ